MMPANFVTKKKSERGLSAAGPQRWPQAILATCIPPPVMTPLLSVAI